MDPRLITEGREIPTESYSDQPYIVKTDDGAWLCVLTTGAGREGQAGQHVVTLRSTNRGKTWDDPVDVEPADGPEASYAVLLKAPSGRVFCFYNYNAENLRRVKADDPPFEGGWCTRVDSLGSYVFRFSDDHGASWSADRFTIPVREMDIDRENAYGGAVRFFWNVGRPFIAHGAAYLSLHKVGGFGEGFFTRSEGVLLKSVALLTTEDPGDVDWETLPEGERGLRTPPGGGPVAEEHSYTVLSDGSIYAIYRTIDGYPVRAISRDQGRTWGVPEYLTYADGRRVKHPRAANFLWRCASGSYLYWFHNHGGPFVPQGMAAEGGGYPYRFRNPVWLSGGVEVDCPEGQDIAWSQPEIALYDDDPMIRMSYPDLIEDDGQIYVSETQKDIARVHAIPLAVTEALWSQHRRDTATREGLLIETREDTEMPTLPALTALAPGRADHGWESTRLGFSLEISFRLGKIAPGTTLLDSRTRDGRGMVLRVSPDRTLELILSDGQTRAIWDTDPGAVREDTPHHLVAIVDAGPRVILFVLDGAVLDGGETRQFGWGRFSPHLSDINGAPSLRIGREAGVGLVRIYDRALLVSEAIGNFRGGEQNARA